MEDLTTPLLEKRRPFEYKTLSAILGVLLGVLLLISATKSIAFEPLGLTSEVSVENVVLTDIHSKGADFEISYKVNRLVILPVKVRSKALFMYVLDSDGDPVRIMDLSFDFRVYPGRSNTIRQNFVYISKVDTAVAKAVLGKEMRYIIQGDIDITVLGVYTKTANVSWDITSMTKIVPPEVACNKSLLSISLFITGPKCTVDLKPRLVFFPHSSVEIVPDLLKLSFDVREKESNYLFFSGEIRKFPQNCETLSINQGDLFISNINKDIAKSHENPLNYKITNITTKKLPNNSLQSDIAEQPIEWLNEILRNFSHFGKAPFERIVWPESCNNIKPHLE